MPRRRRKRRRPSTNRPCRPRRRCWAGSSRASAAPSTGPGPPATGWRGSPPTGSRPSTSGRAPVSGSATSSPPAPWSSSPAAPTAPGSVWSGAGTATFDDIDVAAFEARLDRRLAWARRSIDLPAGRYEVAPPPRRHGRSHGGDVAVHVGPRRRGGPQPVRAPGGGTEGGRVAVPPALRPARRPCGARPRVRPFLVTGASGTDVSVFDNGLRHRPHRLDRRRAFTPPRSITAPARPEPGASPPRPSGTSCCRCPAPRISRRHDRRHDRGLLLTCLWYIREVDPVTLLLTGLTRDGVYLVEHGEVVGAVNNFRFNESPLDVLARAAEAGAHRARPVAGSGASG